MRQRAFAVLVLSVLAVLGPVSSASAGPEDPIPCIKPLWCES